MIVQQLKEKRHQTGGYHAPPFGIAHEIGAMCSMHPTDSGIQQVALQGFETLIKRVLLLSEIFASFPTMRIYRFTGGKSLPKITYVLLVYGTALLPLCHSSIGFAALAWESMHTAFGQ